MSHTISHALQGLREAAGISLEDIAGHLGIEADHLHQVEAGQVRATHYLLAEIAEAIATELRADDRLREAAESVTVGTLAAEARARGLEPSSLIRRYHDDIEAAA